MQVLSVSSLKGGVGKTTIALGIASAALDKGMNTLFVDLDPQCDATTGLAATNDFSESCADVLLSPKPSVVQKAIVEAKWQEGHQSKIHVMVGSTRSLMVDNPQPTLGELWRLEQALSVVEDDYDLVVIDTPPSLNALTRTAWVASDRVLVVSEPSFFSVVAADRARKAINEISSKLSPRLALHGVVVNRLRESSDEHNFRLSELREMFAEKLVYPHFSERTTLQQSTGAATPIHSWPSEAGMDIARSFDSILSSVLSDMKSTPQVRRTRSSNPIERAIRGTTKEALGELTGTVDIVQEKSGLSASKIKRRGRRAKS
ncbi:MAG: ParA family protein [Microbacteriaceae bacterium]|nr:ParA family protein [Microbacteriaceae bacterium]